MKDYFIYGLPTAVIVFGCIQFSIGSILSGIVLSYLIRKTKKLEEQIKNCNGWYQ